MSSLTWRLRCVWRSSAGMAAWQWTLLNHTTTGCATEHMTSDCPTELTKKLMKIWETKHELEKLSLAPPWMPILSLERVRLNLVRLHMWNRTAKRPQVVTAATVSKQNKSKWVFWIWIWYFIIFWKSTDVGLLKNPSHKLDLDRTWAAKLR